MVPAMKAYYDGWEICTACWEELPDGWKPGDAVTYAASGYAVFQQPYGSPFNWMSKLRQTVPASKDMLFKDPSTAHSAIMETLRATVDALKIR